MNKNTNEIKNIYEKYSPQKKNVEKCDEKLK